MEIEFRTRRLEAQFLDHREAEKAYGRPVARKYIQRVNILKSARRFHDVMRLPGLRCHPLKGDRTGQWAVALTEAWRLILKVKGDALEIARIEEVSNHYED